MQSSRRPAGMKKPRSARQEHYQFSFEQSDPKGAGESAKFLRQERREWKRLHAKEGRRLDVRAIKEGDE